MGAQQATLSKRDIVEIRKRTQFSDAELKKLEAEFYRLANSGTKDNVVDIDEFATLIGGSPQDKDIQRLFTLFDTNKDGTLDAKEFICGLAFLSDQATLEGKLQMAFSLYDSDGDGQISMEEYVVVLVVLNSLTANPLPEEALAKIAATAFSLTDSNGDGKISFSEFLPIAKAHPEFFPIAGLITMKRG